MCCCGVFMFPHDLIQPVLRPSKAPRPITGRFVLVACIIFFGVIASVNAVMMTIAIRTMPGLDVRNGYVASQAMNGELEAMRQQAQRAWAADVAVGLKDNAATVSISLTDRVGKPVSGLAVSARLAHLALTRGDHQGELIEQRAGFYAAVLPDVDAGGWTLVIEASQNGERVFMSRNRVVLKEGKP